MHQLRFQDLLVATCKLGGFIHGPSCQHLLGITLSAILGLPCTCLTPAEALQTQPAPHGTPDGFSRCIAGCRNAETLGSGERGCVQFDAEWDRVVSPGRGWEVALDNMLKADQVECRTNLPGCAGERGSHGDSGDCHLEEQV